MSGLLLIHEQRAILAVEMSDSLVCRVGEWTARSCMSQGPVLGEEAA